MVLVGLCEHQPNPTGRFPVQRAPSPSAPNGPHTLRGDPHPQRGSGTKGRSRAQTSRLAPTGSP